MPTLTITQHAKVLHRLRLNSHLLLAFCASPKLLKVKRMKCSLNVTTQALFMLNIFVLHSSQIYVK